MSNMIKMWEDTVGEMHAKCEHKDNEYIVSVTYKGKTLTQSFPQNYPNTFGMDTIDMRISCVMAEEMAKQLES